MVEKEKDIVERLKDVRWPSGICLETAVAAIREIELRRAEIGGYVIECAELRQEIERLRAVLNHLWTIGIPKESVPMVKAALGEERTDG